MIIPVRCFTCGKVVGARGEPFLARTRAGESPRLVLDELGLKRYCCRRMLLSNADLIDEIVPYG
jgi:DNA-directed RNA polymerase subunit N